MKFTIEVNDFYLEEDELSEALLAHLKREVVSQISNNIKDKVEQQITIKVTEAVNSKIALVIDSVLSDLIASETITFNKQEITITQHVKNIFMNNHGWNNPTEIMTKLGKKFGEELKLQYNNIFANKIVQGLKEQGMLRDDVVQMLLTKIEK